MLKNLNEELFALKEPKFYKIKDDISTVHPEIILTTGNLIILINEKLEKWNRVFYKEPIWRLHIEYTLSEVREYCYFDDSKEKIKWIMTDNIVNSLGILYYLLLRTV